MKRCVLTTVVALALVGLVALPVLAAGAKVPKKGTLAGRSYYTAKFKGLFIGKIPVRLNYEVFGITGARKKNSPFYLASCHCLGSMHFTDFKKQAYVSATTCVYTRPNGDKIITKSTAVGKGPVAKGKWTIVGGTGQMKGITGGGTFMRVSVRPAAKWTSQSYNISRGTYQLP